MSLIRLENVSKRFEHQQVLREIYFSLNEGERLGLIGPNGSGKTTVLRLILGQDQPDSGTVSLNLGLRIGYFSQFSELNGSDSILEVLDNLFTEVHEINSELDDIAASMGETSDEKKLDGLVKQQARLFEQMEALDGWNYEYKIETVLSKLGFSDDHRILPIDKLSGGWRNRAALAKILLEEPDVLLLDEPTNYLDIDGQTWLETWIREFRGGLIVVSHDRHFLDSIVTRIVEIDNYRMHEYRGDYTFFVREKRIRLKSLEREFKHEEELLVYESESIADRAEARKNPSKVLQRRLSTIKKMVEPRPIDKIVTSIYERLYVPNNLLTVTGLGKSYDAGPLFSGVDITLLKKDRIVIVGPNGCGKSTLVRCLVDPEEADTGTVGWMKGTKFAFINEIFDDLDLKDTVSHSVNITGLAYLAPRKMVHAFLRLLRFSEVDLTKPIGVLSGGQKARVALAKGLLSGAGVIVMDEPTNHLDITSAQVIERALLHFPGASIIVSHDRFFIDSVATRILAFDGSGGISEVNGNWTIWQAMQNA